MEISSVFEAGWRLAQVKPYFKFPACLSYIYILETNTQCYYLIIHILALLVVAKVVSLTLIFLIKIVCRYTEFFFR